MRRIAASGALIAFALSLFVLLASAETNRAGDPDDTRGVLDVRVVRFERLRGKPPSWTVVTFQSWRARSLWDRGFVYVLLDTGGRVKADYYALIRSDGSQMVGALFRVASAEAPDREISRLSVSRRSMKSVTVRIPLKLLHFPEGRTFYRWWVSTSLTSEKCPRSCLDRVPDEGALLQYRPGMKPGPSPSPSPSPSSSASP